MNEVNLYFMESTPRTRKAERYIKRVEKKREKAKYIKCAVAYMLALSVFLLVFDFLYNPPERGINLYKSPYARFEDVSGVDTKPIPQKATTGHSATFTATAYCLCEKCCGVWASKRGSGPAVGAAGTPLVPGVSVAIDRDLFSFGTALVDENGHTYIAQDTGSGVNGYWIDIFMESHEEARQWGKQEVILSW